MATITAADVKKLRDATGAGMMDAKKALTEAEGDFDKAVEVLRVSGQAKAAKRAERSASNGLVASTGGALIQLGAFPSEASANAAWSALAKRFGYVATLGKVVQPATVNGRTVYRLRVNAGSANAASDICGRLKVAGEGCFVTS